MKPALASMSLRKKNISELVRLGMNPILANNTQYMQRCSTSLVINLVGLRDAVFGILGFKDDKQGHVVLHKVVETSVDIALKKAKELGIDVLVTMTKSDGSGRFISLDEEKYGKNSILKITENETYTEGVVIDATTLADLTIKSPQIVECNRMAKTLNGGLFTQVKIPNGSKITEIKKNIEKVSNLTNSFKLIMRVPLCGNCGLKDQTLVDKCPTCKSSYII